MSSYEIPTLLSQENLNKYQFVFVGGYMNEIVRDQYFSLNVETMNKMGAEHVTSIFPSSLVAVEKNRHLLFQKIKELYKQNGEKPIILVGHSKGGLESLATILAYPELVLNKMVAEVVLVQAPLTGNIFLDQQGSLSRLFSMGLSVSPGHDSLQTREIKKMIEQKLEEMDPAVRQKLSRVVKYVISSKPQSEFSKALRLGGIFLGIKAKYDGLVARRDMWIPGFGTVIADIVADHLEFLLGKSTFLGDSFNPEKIEAFTKSLFFNLFKSRNTRISEYRELTQAVNASRPPEVQCRSFWR